MFLDPYISITESLLKAWLTNKKQLRASLLLAIGGVVVALVFQMLASLEVISQEAANNVSGILGVAAGALVLAVVAYQNLLERQERQEKLEIVEERVREHPERPQLAWDLARIKLESYLDRN